jgi:hypothetical protein
MDNSLGAEDMKSSKSVAAVSGRSIFLKAEQSDGQGAPLQNRFDDKPYLRLNPDVRAANIDLTAITCFRARPKADSSDEATPPRRRISIHGSQGSPDVTF